MFVFVPDRGEQGLWLGGSSFTDSRSIWTHGFAEKRAQGAEMGFELFSVFLDFHKGGSKLINKQTHYLDVSSHFKNFGYPIRCHHFKMTRFALPRPHPAHSLVTACPIDLKVGANWSLWRVRRSEIGFEPFRGLSIVNKVPASQKSCFPFDTFWQQQNCALRRCFFSQYAVL